jgi:hypothetical protein
MEKIYELYNDYNLNNHYPTGGFPPIILINKNKQFVQPTEIKKREFIKNPRAISIHDILAKRSKIKAFI